MKEESLAQQDVKIFEMSVFSLGQGKLLMNTLLTGSVFGCITMVTSEQRNLSNAHKERVEENQKKRKKLSYHTHYILLKGFLKSELNLRNFKCI